MSCFTLGAGEASSETNHRQPQEIINLAILFLRQPQNLSWIHSKSKHLISFATSTEEVPG
jgi:hypothetical protein